MREVRITVYGRPEPQGSSKAFIVAGKARITSANVKMKPYRNQVSQVAACAISEAVHEFPFALKHVPVRLSLDFYFARPDSVPKRRQKMVVKPDLDKITRSTTDALTGIFFHDDAQVVEYVVKKHYGAPERAEIMLEVLE